MRCIFLVVAFLFGGNAMAAPALSPINPGMLGSLVGLPGANLKLLYSFDTTSISGTAITDLSGTSATGTLVNTPTIAAGASGFGEAITFVAASSQRVDPTYTAVLDSGIVLDPASKTTFVAHFKGTQAHVLFSNYFNAGSGPYGYRFHVDTDGLHATLDSTAAGAAIEQLVTAGTVTDDAWHDLVLVVDMVAQTAVGYVDGVAGSPVSLAGLPGSPDSSSGLRIATSALGGSGFTSGTEDELAVFNTALTARQALLIHNLRLAAVPLKVRLGL